MTHGSVFSGIGGPEVAASMLGWENLFHCEINPFGRKILDYYYPNAESYEDITKTDFTKWRGRVNVLTGGFPCQPFSYAGRRRGAEDDRYLWPYMFRCIDQIQPDWVVCENVAGILTMVEQGEVTQMASAPSLFDEGNDVRGRFKLRETFTLERICDDLESHGYAVQSILIPACGVGAPHKRDRVFIIGHRNGLAEGSLADTIGKGLEGMHESGSNKGKHGDGIRRDGAGHGGQTIQSGASVDTESECSERMRLGQSEDSVSRPRVLGGTDFADGSRETSSDADGNRGCQVDEHVESEIADGSVAVSNGRERYASDTDSKGLEGSRGQGLQESQGWFDGEAYARWCYGDTRSERPESGSCGARWAEFPTVSPIHRGNDGLPFPLDDLTISAGKWRTESLKAYGNAIVPQVMYEIFRAIEKVEEK